MTECQGWLLSMPLEFDLKHAHKVQMTFGNEFKVNLTTPEPAGPHQENMKAEFHSPSLTVC